MKVIAISNQKGGVAKTTTAINLAAALTVLDKRILLIDMDPQSNTTSGLDMKEEIKYMTYDILIDGVSLKDSIVKTKWDNLDFIGTNLGLANAELELGSKLGRETVLRDAIKDAKISNQYDYIIIDTNPSLGNLTINALAATDEVIIPIEPGKYALEGINHFIKIINLLRNKINPDLKIGGVLLTRVDDRTNISAIFIDTLKEIFKDQVFRTMIHTNVKIGEAAMDSVPVIFYDAKCRGTMEYLELAKEVVRL